MIAKNKWIIKKKILIKLKNLKKKKKKLKVKSLDNILNYESSSDEADNGEGDNSERDIKYDFYRKFADHELILGDNVKV